MGTILLVEDNEDDIFAFQRMLKIAQVENPVQVLKHGQEAIEYLSGAGKYADRLRHPLPFIVFLDLKLPYLSGFEVLGWIRSRTELNSIVIVVLTSSSEDRNHQRAYSLGARSYLVKPPTAEVFLDLVKSLQSHWAALGRPEPFQINSVSK